MSVARCDIQDRVRAVGADEQSTDRTPAEAILQHQPAITGKKLLVVDDEVAVLKALVAVFHRDGHAVDTAANGLQAIAKLRERPYDLLVCDLRMPDFDGADLYRALAKTYPHLLPRMIFLTGDTLSPETQVFLAASGVPYLFKPCGIMELRRVVQHTLQRLSAADGSRSRALQETCLAVQSASPRRGHG